MKTSHLAILSALLIAAPATAQFKPMSEDLLTAVREIAMHVAIPTPHIDALLGLTRLFARTRGLYPR